MYKFFNSYKSMYNGINLIIITLGDPGGISAEILVKSLYNNQHLNFQQDRILIFGSYDIIMYFIKLYRIDVDIKLVLDFEKLKNIDYLNSLFKRSYILIYDPFYEANKNVISKFKLFKTANNKEFKNKRLKIYDKSDNAKKIISEKKFLKIIKIGQISKINGFFAERYLNMSLNFIKFLLRINNNKLNDKIGINFIKNKYRFNLSLLTLPVNKKSISLVKPKFIGHTEYIANYFKIKNVTMTMHSDNITVSLVSTHIPLFKLKYYVNRKSFENTLRNAILFYELMDFRDGIGVLGLNPHASDNGIIGNDEIWIKNIIEKYKNNFETNNKKDNNYIKNNKKNNNKTNKNQKKAGYKAIKIDGPIPADTAFAIYNQKTYSIYIAFYHDQGLIPFKLLAKGKGTNITFGLPFLRISPDHGTGFDIAGKNVAKIDSIDKCFQVIKKINKNFQ